MTARTAVAVAERYAATMADHERYVEDRLDNRMLLPNGLPDEAAIERHYGRVGVQTVLTAQQNALVRKVWQRHRIVYDIHPALWEALGETGTDAIIPEDLFTRLPHPDPFIAFPEPLIMPLGDGRQQRIYGIFVYGLRGRVDGDGVTICSTSDRTGPDLALAFGGEKEDPDGTPVLGGGGSRDMAWGWINVDPTSGDRTVGSMIDLTLTQIGADTDLTAVDWQAMLSRIIRRSISLLVYLCATNADLRPLPRQTSGGVHRPNARKDRPGPKPSRPVGVGYRIGAALEAHRRREASAEGAPTGRHVAPHVRRAHFHLYWRGPRSEQVPEVKWLPPIPVNVDGDAEQSTVVPVRPHKPAKADR